MDIIRPIRALVVDDHQAVREGLASPLHACNGIQVVEQAENTREAVRKTVELESDVILLDLRLPGCNGLAVCGAILGAVPEARVLMLTSYQEDDYLLDALDAGAWGCLPKTAEPEKMVEAVTVVAAGQRL
jgi:DNA-binding NarL/FixJ family response regulator